MKNATLMFDLKIWSVKVKVKVKACVSQVTSLYSCNLGIPLLGRALYKLQELIQHS